MAGAGLLTVLALLLIGFPIALLTSIVRAWRRWAAVDLLKKSRIRAGAASFVLVALALYVVRRGISSMIDVELYVVASVAAFATLWLVAGLAGSQGSLRYDPMSLFWYGLVGLAAISVLFVEGWPF